MSGGSSGSSKMNIADYYMSIHYGVCMGPVDSIDEIRINEKSIGMPAYSVNATWRVKLMGLFGGAKKNGGVSGYIDIMMGGPDQVATPALASRLGRPADQLPGFRGFVSLFFYSGDSSNEVTSLPGFYWSSNYPTIPPVDVTVTRYPIGPNGEKMAGPNGLANPSHMIYECLTNRSWGMGCPVGLIDPESFQAAATTLANEGLWLGMGWYRSDTIENFVGEILDHIQAALGPDPSSGKWRLKLLRGDYNTDSLFIVHPGNARVTKMQRKLWGETANEVSVTWTNPDNEEEESITFHDDANIAAQGQVVSTSRNYYGVRSASLASTLAVRDLRQSASPLLSVDVEIDRRGWNVKPGDVVEFRWPEYGIGSCFMRVGDINYGEIGSSYVQTSLLEDIFGIGSAIFTEMQRPKPGDPIPKYPPDRPGHETPPPVVTPIPPEPQPPEWVDPSESPRPLDHLWLGTAPYFMLARILGDAGMANYVYPIVGGMSLVSQDSNDTQTIGRWAQTLDVTGNATFALQSMLPNMVYCTLPEAIEPGALTTVSGLPVVSGLGQPIVGNYLLLHDPDNWDMHEICAIETLNTDGSFILRRGVIDTIPLEWPAGTVAFAFDGDNTNVFDSVQYADGSEVSYKFTPTTSRGALSAADAPTETIELSGRPHYPYRPANVRIDGDLWTEVYEPQYGDQFVVTWSRRNRLTETGQLLRWTDGDVLPEDGQTTALVFYDEAGVEDHRISGITGTSYTLTEDDFTSSGGGIIGIKIISERDGHDSLNGITRYFDTKNMGGYGFNYGNSYGE